MDLEHRPARHEAPNSRTIVCDCPHASAGRRCCEQFNSPRREPIFRAANHSLKG